MIALPSRVHRRLRSAENFFALARDARAHYDAHPYEVDVRDSRVYGSPESPIGRFLAGAQGLRVLDVGCGPGNLLPAIARRASRTVGLDISRESLRLARASGGAGAALLVQGDARGLPFRDAAFDRAVAAGSLHHTGDARAAFGELCRVLGPAGEAFVAVYRAGSYYERMYRSVGAVARACERGRVARVVVNRAVLLPLFAAYVVAGRLIVHRRLAPPARAQLWNYFADQVLNPVVSFHTLPEVAEWAREAGVRIVRSASAHGGALWNLHLRREREAAA